jgi:hypothetical protein
MLHRSTSAPPACPRHCPLRQQLLTRMGEPAMTKTLITTALALGLGFLSTPSFAAGSYIVNGRAFVDQPPHQPGTHLQSLWPIKAEPSTRHSGHAPSHPRSRPPRDRGAVRALTRTRPSRLHRRPHRLRCPHPLHNAAGAQRLCRDRDQVQRGARRRRLTLPAPLRRLVAHCWRLHRSQLTRLAARTHRNSSGASNCSSPRCSSAAIIRMAAFS